MEKIIVIDDSATARMGIERILKPLNAEIIQAVNGVDGIRKILRHHPALITMDLGMPILNGLMTTKIMKLLGLHIPTIFVTGETALSDYQEKYPSVIDTCLKDELQEHLFKMSERAMNSIQRQYKDVEYSFTQKEFKYLASASGRKRILIVDDSKSMRDIMASHLEYSGIYEIFQARDGQEGFLKAVMIQPDLILSDVEMPEVDGISMAQMLYILGWPIPLAFASSLNDQATIERALKLKGILGYLIKTEVLKDGNAFRHRVEKMLQIMPSEKQLIRKSYQEIDLNRLDAENQQIGIFQESL